MPVILPETIVRRRCAALIPYARNARTHSDQQVAQIAASHHRCTIPHSDAAAGRRSVGSVMGRKPKLTEAQQAEARRRRAEGATLAELARSYHVGKSTISRL